MNVSFKKQIERFVDTNTLQYSKSHGVKAFSFLLYYTETPKMFLEMANGTEVVVEGEEDILAYINKL